MGDAIDRIIRNWRKKPSKPNKPTPIPIPTEPISDPIISDPISGHMSVVRITRDHHNVSPIGMSYWRNINQHAGSDILEVCLSIDDQLTTFMLEKGSLDVLSERSLGIHHTGEGIHYSRKYSDMLYYGMGKAYNKLNTKTNASEVVWHSGFNLWQCHMDYEEQTFSGTLKDDNWNIVGWGVNEQVFPVKHHPDECQIDKSGKWLCIKETINERLINRFIRVDTGAERIIYTEEGAIGHSDCGFGYILGENSFSNVGGAVDLFDMNTGGRRLVWNSGTWNLGYVSCTNARPDKNESFLVSSADGRLILVGMDGSATHICDLPITNDYPIRPKANLCPNGEYAIWTDARSGKLDAYIVRIPR